MADPFTEINFVYTNRQLRNRIGSELTDKVSLCLFSRNVARARMNRPWRSGMQSLKTRPPLELEGSTFQDRLRRMPLAAGIVEPAKEARKLCPPLGCDVGEVDSAIAEFVVLLVRRGFDALTHRREPLRAFA